MRKSLAYLLKTLGVTAAIFAASTCGRFKATPYNNVSEGVGEAVGWTLPEKDNDTIKRLTAELEKKLNADSRDVDPVIYMKTTPTGLEIHYEDSTKPVVIHKCPNPEQLRDDILKMQSNDRARGIIRGNYKRGEIVEFLPSVQYLGDSAPGISQLDQQMLTAHVMNGLGYVAVEKRANPPKTYERNLDVLIKNAGDNAELGGVVFKEGTNLRFRDFVRDKVKPEQVGAIVDERHYTWLARRIAGTASPNEITGDEMTQFANTYSNDTDLRNLYTELRRISE